MANDNMPTQEPVPVPALPDSFTSGTVGPSNPAALTNGLGTLTIAPPQGTSATTFSNPSSTSISSGTIGVPVGAGSFNSTNFTYIGTPQTIVTNTGQATSVDCNCSTDVTVSANNSPINLSDAAGRRVRLRPRPGGADDVYCCGSSPILNIIRNTNGMVWPYQPLITYSQDVDYKSMELTHANQDIYAYHRTPSVKLAVDGEFSVQNQTEGMYAMACIHYLRSVTKMYFGENDPNRGTPPPVLLFDAYGAYMFNALPVIVTNFSIGLPKDVDYVPVDMTGFTQAAQVAGNWTGLTNTNLTLNSTQNSSIAWLPAVFNIQIQLIVQNTPYRLRQFDLGAFKTGTLLTQGGWI